MPSLNSTKALTIKAGPILTACPGRHFGFYVFNASQRRGELWETQYESVRDASWVMWVGQSVCPNRSQVPLAKIFFLTNKGQEIAAEASEKKCLGLELSDTNPITNNLEMTVGNPDPH